MWRASSRKNCRRQRLFASFRSHGAANAPYELDLVGSAESAKPFKCLFLKLLLRHRELIAAGTRRAFNLRRNRSAEVQCQTDLGNGLSYITVRFGEETKTAGQVSEPEGAKGEPNEDDKVFPDRHFFS